MHFTLLNIVVLAALATAASQTPCSLLDPPPASRVCGVHGQATDETATRRNLQVGGDAIVDSLETCKNYCLKNPQLDYDMKVRRFHHLYDQCRVFSFDTRTKQCSLFWQFPRKEDFGVKPPPQMHASLDFVQNDTSPVIFYDINCFTSCTANCPQPLGVNILDNPGFQDSNTSFTPWGVGQNKIRPSLDGGVVTPRPGTGAFLNPTSVCQRRPVCIPGAYASQRYMFSVDVRQSAVEPVEFGSFTLRTSGASSGGNAELDSIGSHDWFTLSGSADTGAGGYTEQMKPAYIELCGAGQYVDIDNLVLTPLPATVPTKGANLLTNGGFESGKIAPWDNGTGRGTEGGVAKVVCSSKALSGSCFLLFESPGPDPYPYASLSLSQEYTQTPGKLYVLHFDYLVPAPTVNGSDIIVGGIKLTAELFDGIVGSIDNFDFNKRDPGLDEQHFPFNTKRSFELIFSPINPRGTFFLSAFWEIIYLDNFYIKEVDLDKL